MNSTGARMPFFLAVGSVAFIFLAIQSRNCLFHAKNAEGLTQNAARVSRARRDVNRMRVHFFYSQRSELYSIRYLQKDSVARREAARNHWGVLAIECFCEFCSTTVCVGFDILIHKLLWYFAQRGPIERLYSIWRRHRRNCSLCILLEYIG